MNVRSPAHYGAEFGGPASACRQAVDQKPLPIQRRLDKLVIVRCSDTGKRDGNQVSVGRRSAAPLGLAKKQR